MDELIKQLREDAEWVKTNCWETPITLPDHLKKAADAIEALTRKVDRYENTLTIPKQGQTVYGYPLNELLCFAQMCRRHGIEEKDLHDFCLGVENGFLCGVDDWNRAQENMVRLFLERHDTKPPEEG